MTPTNLKDLIARARELRAGATQGEWHFSSNRIITPDGAIVEMINSDADDEFRAQDEADAALIVHAVNTLPTLLDALEGALEEIRQIEACINGHQGKLILRIKRLETALESVLACCTQCDANYTCEACGLARSFLEERLP